jgi:hypothetical protein
MWVAVSASFSSASGAWSDALNEILGKNIQNS